jgi:hypothetical protein
MLGGLLNHEHFFAKTTKTSQLYKKHHNRQKHHKHSTLKPSHQTVTVAYMIITHSRDLLDHKSTGNRVIDLVDLITLHNSDTVITRLGVGESTASNSCYYDNLVFHNTGRPSRLASRRDSRVSAAFRQSTCEFGDC